MNNILRQQYLDAIGIQNWQLKSASYEDFADDIPNIDDAHAFDSQVAGASEATLPIIEEKPPVIVQEKVEQAHVEQQISETVNNHVENSLAENNQSTVVSAPEKTSEVLTESPLKPVNIISTPVELVSELDQAIRDCKQCPKRQTRLNAISGYGNNKASVFIISEAPTAEEDRSAHYLNEQTSSLLQLMFQSINLQDDYFYTGIIKCYSLTDFLYSDEEVNHCAPFLYTQIEQSRPSVLVILGAVQAQIILQSKKTFNELRGITHHITINGCEYPAVVTYHPAYLLRNPQYKREALADLIMIKQLSDDSN